MTGLEISKKTPLTLFYWAVSCVLFAVTFGIAWGPKGIVAASGIGAVLSSIDLWLRHRRKDGLLLPLVMLSTHLLFLIVAALLAFFFLAPLHEGSLNMPKLTQYHTDLNGSFRVRLPEGWSVEPLHATHEIGVRAHPSDRASYMGVAELTVRVRSLENKQQANVQFFEKMASTLSLTNRQKKRLFEFRTEPAVLLNNQAGFWSFLILKRFWIPLYQTSLFGLHKSRFLCSVATSGIKSHDQLAKVLCLGVMESIQMTENADKTH